MASSESSMDFSARVSKIFDSLGPSQQQQQPWSLTDNEVERREWRRETDTSDRDQRPCSASFDDFLKEERRSRNLRKEFEDEDDDDQLRGGNDEDWEIRSSIGLDPTLDHEDEEDEYDKVASGRDYDGERVYMGDITDRGSYLNWQNVVPDPLCVVTKDRRANCLAAKIRLKEDDEAEAKKIKSHHVGDTEVKKPQPRSILKRKQDNEDFKSKKRVRFDPGCKNDWEEASAEQFQDASMSTTCSVNATVSDDGSLNAYGVPDYILNPSRYTRYSFDSSSEVDEGSNTQAFMDFLKLVKRSDPTQCRPELEDASADLPKSVTFIPKKKAGDVKAVDNNSESKQNREDDSKQTLHQAVFPVGIAAEEAQHCEVSAMEEDQPETNAADKSASFQKPGRRYRTKSRSDDSDSC